MRRTSIVTGFVLALFVTGCSGPSAQERITVAQKTIKKLDNAIKEYTSKHNGYPAGLSVLVSEGLVEETDLNDPWDQEYKYDAEGTKHHKRKPDIWTTTPDNTRTLSN